jgi:hypothetical protein
MKKYEKIYIGKAKEHERLEGVITVTIAMAKAEEFIFEYKGQEYLRFEVAERLTNDVFGNTHAAYVLQKVGSVPAEVAEPAPVAAKPKRSRKKQS